MSGRHGKREEPRRVARAAAPEARTGARGGASARTVAPVAVSAQHLAGRRRAAKQDRERRRRKRQRVVAAAAALALVVAAAVLALTLGRGDRDTSSAAGKERTQRTVLFQLRRTDGTAVSSALLAHDPGPGKGAMVLLPSEVIAEVPGVGRQPFGRALIGPDGVRTARATAADLLGVTVDASWVLTQGQLKALVDRLGGVVADVDTRVTAVRGGARVVLAEAGRGQRLTGDAAASYASLRLAREDELARMPRLQAVLEGVLDRLPPTTGLDPLLRAVGVPATPAPATYTPTLLGLQDDLRRQALTAETLPVVAFDVGADQPAYRIDPDGVRALTRRLLADSVPASQKTGGNRVLVLNGVGTPGIGEKVRTKIVPAGFVYVSSRNQKPFGRAKTVVVVGDSRESSLEAGRRLALALGLPDAPVQVLPRGQSVADLLVVVGKDFSP